MLKTKKIDNSFNVLIQKGANKTINNNMFMFNDYVPLPEDIIPRLLIGDVIEQLQRIPDKTISVVVTSPPYWNLRDYYSDEQIGQEKDPAEYINKIVTIGNEILRILKDDGAYFLNIGDTYIDKNLQMIPQRVAIGMQGNGWLVRNQIIWYKPDHMPSPVKSRFSNTYEPIYLFTKNDWEKKVFFNIDTIRIPHKTTNKIQKSKNGDYKGKFKGNEKNIGASPGARMSISDDAYTLKRKIELPQSIICDYLRYWRTKRGYTVNQLDRIFGYSYTAGHWFRKDAGGSLPTVEDWKKLKQILKFDNKYDKEMTETEYVLQVVQNHPKGKNPGDMWMMNTAKTSYEHFSIFPEEIPTMAIKACCPKNGVVLDPFAGSGTTGKVAKELNRKSILIDIQRNFLPIIKERCGEIIIL